MTTPGFEYFNTGPKVRCVVCHRTGYDGGLWQNSCKQGHPFECGECGHRFSTSHGRANHQRLMKNHQGNTQLQLEVEDG